MKVTSTWGASFGVCACVLAWACPVRGGDAPLPIYSNSLAPGWANWSWNTYLSFAASSPAHGGSGNSISVTYTAAWAGLYLHNGSPVSASDFVELRFWIHGGAAGGQEIQVSAVDAAFTWSPAIAITPPLAGAWAEVTLPITSFGLATIGGLVWQDANGGPQPTYYLDDIAFIASEPPEPGTGPALAVDVALDRHPISPFIYGINFADSGFAAEIGLPVNRFGGNATTRYNWQNDTSNRASDWFFENIPNDNPDPGALPDGSSSDQFVDTNLAAGAESLLTLPLIGWTPKSRQYACGYSVAEYGPQQQVDPWRPDCGNGILTNGTPITWNDPTDTSLAIGPAFVQGWLNHLIGRYGRADEGGVRFFCLDNEPMLWNSTHRDVHPDPVGYDELRDRTIQYAAAVKAVDPAAQTLGYVAWGWSAYFYSALDVAAGGDWWNTRPDRRAHGDVPLVEWYLHQMRTHEESSGTRILDYLDLHYYPQANVALQPAGDAATRARRLRSTRSLWDPTYVDESWIAEPVRLIPRMRDWVAAHYPGTRLAITEYNWGGLEAINGALAQADVLGIFGREKLELACLWDPPGPAEPGSFSFRMYRNYDGAGGRFGEISVRASSADPDEVSAYAAMREDGDLTLMLINKSTAAQTCPLTLSNFQPQAAAAIFRYSGANLSQIIRGADVTFTGGQTSLDLPGSSVNLLVVPGPPPGDCDADGDVDLTDYACMAACLMGPAGGLGAGCERFDFDGDSDVDLHDFARFDRF